MELEELKSAWKTANEKLDRMQLSQLLMQQELVATRTKSISRRLMAEPIFELLVGILAVRWAGEFLWDHQRHIQRFPLGGVPAFLIWAFGVFTISISVRQLVLASTVSSTSSVLTAQRSVASLRALRVQSTKAVMLVGIPLWFIFPIFAGQELISFDIVKALNPGLILANLFFGGLVSAGLILASRRFSQKSAFFRVIDDVFAGTATKQVEQMLAELRQFEAVWQG